MVDAFLTSLLDGVTHRQVGGQAETSRKGAGEHVGHHTELLKDRHVLIQRELSCQYKLLQCSKKMHLQSVQHTGTVSDRNR